MKNCLILLLLFTGLVPLVLSVSRKYYLIQQNKSWTDAQTFCRAEHTDLAVVKDNEDKIRLQDELQTKRFSSAAWIGMNYDTNSWRWSMGNEPLGSYRAWYSGEPTNGGGVEDCVFFTSSGWYDFYCTDTFPFVCFDDRNTGDQRYIRIPDLKSWSDAQTYCRQFHTDLTSARDSAEWSAILGLGSGYTWFGLFRDSWKWTDQTSFSTLSWMSGQPNNSLKNGNCGYINNALVGDALCSDILPFICYRDVTGQQQIVRMKFRSSEDVNDPAAMVAILDQIRKKLEEKGMKGNFTLKWRKQADGEVFHKQEIEKNTTVENKT